MRDNSLRIAVSPAPEPAEQLRDFLAELDFMQQVTEAEASTSLLVLSQGPGDFDAFMALVHDADDLLDAAGLRGVFQLAHFHPRYQFHGEAPQSLSHFTNRSPLPVLHLLRESTLTRVLEGYPNPEEIPGRNIERLEALGRDAVLSLWKAPED